MDCLRHHNNIENKILTVSQTGNGITINSANSVVYTSKRYKFVEEQQAKGILSSFKTVWKASVFELFCFAFSYIRSE